MEVSWLVLGTMVGYVLIVVSGIWLLRFAWKRMKGRDEFVCQMCGQTFWAEELESFVFDPAPALCQSCYEDFVEWRKR